MNKVKFNKMRTGKKKKLLVERLIGTGKRKQKYIKVSILLVIEIFLAHLDIT